MTTTARKVLADCKNAHEMLEIEEDVSRFRVLWVAGVALVRAVGHVLKNVDSAEDSKLAQVVKKAHQAWTEDKDTNVIFFDFIQQERNNILKEYQFGFLSGSTEVVVLPQSQLFMLGDNLFCPISDGRYTGEDCRDVLADAITWWEQQLCAIDAQVKF